MTEPENPDLSLAASSYGDPDLHDEVLPSGEPAEGLIDASEAQQALQGAMQEEVQELVSLSDELDKLRGINGRLLTPAERRQAQQRLKDAEALKAKRRAASKRAAQTRKNNRNK